MTNTIVSAAQGDVTIEPTLSETELFQHFLRMRIVNRTKSGAIARDYVPNDILRDIGMHGTLMGASELIADGIEAEANEDGLKQAVEDIENYASVLRNMIFDYQQCKAQHFIGGDDDHERYRVPDEFNGVRFIADGSARA